MTTHAAGIVANESAVGAQLRKGSLSGTVTSAGAGVVRRIFVVKKNSHEILGSTTSDAVTGAFSVEVSAGSLDRLEVICVGATDTENSVIFSNITT